MHVKDLFDLNGRCALVTGGSRGLGLQMAQALGEMGCAVALCARRQTELNETAEKLDRAGVRVLAVPTDLLEPQAAVELVSAVERGLGPIDILLKNAGASWSAPAESHPIAAWNKVMNLNVTAPFVLAQEVARRHMIPRGAGKIINVASVAGLRGTARGVRTAAYNTSKAALINLTRALASEWGRFNINVNAICPGFFPTRMSSGLLE